MWPHFYQSFPFDSTPFPHLSNSTNGRPQTEHTYTIFWSGGETGPSGQTMYKFTKYLDLCSSKWMPRIAPGNEPNLIHTILWDRTGYTTKNLGVAILYVKSQYIRITIANIAFVLHDGLLYVQWAQKFNHNLLQWNLIGPDVTNLFTLHILGNWLIQFSKMRGYINTLTFLTMHLLLFL